MKEPSHYAHVIDRRLWVGSQSLNGTLIVRVVDTQLRATIERDHYENQCSAKVVAWIDSCGWREVATVPIRDLPEIFACESRYAKGWKGWQNPMERSLRYLIRLAVFVLFKQATKVEFEEAA